MDLFITILLVTVTLKFIVFGILIWKVFRKDIAEYLSGNSVELGLQTVPSCVYCQSKWTRSLDEGQARWQDGELVIVTAYQCEHCNLPFWRVERVRTAVLKN